ncbi:copper amine oxidase N-terminal domain-containing protein [Kyrpidia sp.]|uniref:copper amine oxidase N-terminal domain-containing protein n=1 Tax=Kyrpidia sp. TaxID=2073077 RepID=UPI002583F5B8|nr:copper amine oxidase N-terminal domain-containing protein [Kyrpidia sp.]MCL6576977.1 copper amine oxidase N-terminal domain-containing protein [Kyrpidia sp.]
MKRGKKALAVLSTAALLGTTPAAVALPFLTSSVAYAAGTATAITTPNISTSQPYADLGTIDMFIPKGALGSVDPNGNTQVTLLLPSGFQFDSSLIGKTWGNTDVTDSTTSSFWETTTSNTVANLPTKVYNTYNNGTNTINIYAPYVDGIAPGGGSVHWTIGSPTLLKITVDSAAQSDDWHLFVHLPSIKVSGPGNGPVNVTMIAPSTSPLPTGSVTVGNVATAGKVDLAATDVVSSSDHFTFNLAVSEEVAQSLRPGQALKLKLPSGFKWDATAVTSGDATSTSDTANVVVADVYGDPHVYTDTNNNSVSNIKVTNDGDQTLWINVDHPTKQASGYLITNLGFYVDDETVARAGDVTVLVTGGSTTNVSNLVVGHYGQIGFQATAESQPTLIAGQKEQIIGDIIIKETVPGSFVSGRTVTLTLPDTARWESQFENRNSTDIQGAYSATNGIYVSKIQYTDTDKRTLKLTIGGESSANSTNPAEIDLRNMQVALQPGFSGDLNVELGGTEGVTGNVTVATVQSPVSVKVDNAPNVIIGSGSQDIGTITLTENVAGGFAKTTVGGKTYNQVHIELPYGVQFDGTPNVEVTQGDLSIKDISSGLGSDNKGYLDFYVDAESTTPSVITISGAKLKLDRTVPQGDIVLKVKGSSVSYTAYAVDQTDESTAVQPWADNNKTAASTVIAHVTTPAQSGSNVATFTVGSTTYTVNGQQQTMDVAPYLKNDGRVMLPVRFVANALGVSDDSIIWNQNDKSVTIFKGGSVVKMTLGSNTLIVNGTAVQMDVAPELYNDGRVMLPIRWVGQALNANISWDQATQTVTVTTQQ